MTLMKYLNYYFKLEKNSVQSTEIAVWLKTIVYKLDIMTWFWFEISFETKDILRVLYGRNVEY